MRTPRWRCGFTLGIIGAASVSRVVGPHNTMSPKKLIGWIARGLMAVYWIHVIVVCSWEFIPMERHDVQGVRYEIRRGFGFPAAFIPPVGILPIVGDEPVRLITTNLTTGHRETKDYDVAYDIYQAHPEIWPESRR